MTNRQYNRPIWIIGSSSFQMLSHKLEMPNLPKHWPMGVPLVLWGVGIVARLRRIRQKHCSSRMWIYGIGPSCFFTMYAGIRPLCTSIWYNSSLDDASMILHLTSVFIEILHFWWAENVLEGRYFIGCYFGDIAFWPLSLLEFAFSMRRECFRALGI